MAFLNIFFKTLGLLVGIATFFIIVNISLFFLSVEGQNFKFVEGKQESENIIAIIDINGPIINNFKNKFLSNITDFIEPENIKKILLNLEKIKPKIL